jgi:hypothetical protein
MSRRARTLESQLMRQARELLLQNIAPRFVMEETGLDQAVTYRLRSELRAEGHTIVDARRTGSVYEPSREQRAHAAKLIREGLPQHLVCLRSRIPPRRFPEILRQVRREQRAAIAAAKRSEHTTALARLERAIRLSPTERAEINARLVAGRPSHRPWLNVKQRGGVST